MRKLGKLELIPTDTMSRKEWLIKRQEGLGGSDMGTILGLNHRFSRLQLFYQKLGLDFTASDEHNAATLLGTILEDDVNEIAQYYDFNSNDPDHWVDNYVKGEKKREIAEFKYMVRNSDYPWLLSNIDGAIDPEYSKKEEGLIIRMDMVGECKTITRQAAEMWQDNFPPYYLAQGLMYGTVLEPILNNPGFQIYLLQDNRVLTGHKFTLEEAKPVADAMIQKSYEFWELLEAGKEIIANATSEDEMWDELSAIEPAPDTTPSYERYLSEIYLKKKSYQKIIGDSTLWEWAVRHDQAAKQIKDLEAEKQLARNILKKAMKDAGADVIDFGDNGRITFNKRLYINIK